MNNLIYKKIFFILLLVLFLPLSVFASEVRLEISKIKIKNNEQLLTSVFLYSDDPINAIEGKLEFDPEALEVKQVREGNSVINFWIEEPNLQDNNSGDIVFSGITPGGISGVNNLLFSVVFEAKKVGPTSINMNNMKALLDDGLGTEEVLRLRNIVFDILPGDSNIYKEVSVIDNELPEKFNPIIEKDPNLFDGKYFLVFNTKDKISGMAYFKVREGYFGFFKKAESPYLLKYQKLDRDITIKAVDKAGNKRIVLLNAQNQTSVYPQYLIFGITLLVLIFIFFLKKVWSRFTRS